MSSALRAACDPFDLPSNTQNNGYNTNYTNNNNNQNNNLANFPFKPLAMSFTQAPRPHLSMAEQAELEFELRYRGNMIVDQQRKIQQLEEELKRTRDQVDLMNNQINTYEQERMKERKKPQSRYWTPDEHQRFLEALTKYGHKDVKAISMHVSTRNATQVRTHAQKYFLRLERERRKKGEEDGKDSNGPEMYNSSGDEMYNSDQSLSPSEEMSPPTSNIGSPSSSSPGQQSQLAQAVLTGQPLPRRRRSGSLITPTMGKYAVQQQSAVLAELPSWSVEDYEQFCKGLSTIIDKQEDLSQICRSIRDAYLPHLSLDDIEACYRTLHKVLKTKPIITPSVGSPKRRRTSKGELPISMPLINENGPLPNIMNSNNNNNGNNGNSNFSPFMANVANVPGSPLSAHQQYVQSNNINHNHGNNNNGSVTLLPFQMNAMNMRPMNTMTLDYGNMPPVASLQVNSLGLGMSNLGMLDMPNSNPNPHWNTSYLSFDLHQNTPSVLSLPQGTPLVSSLN